MPELDPVRQDITADADQYLATLDQMILKAQAAANALAGLQDRLAQAGITADDAATTFEAAASRANDMANAVTKAGTAAGAASAGLGDVSSGAGEAADSFNYLARIASYLNATFGLVVASEDVVLSSSAKLAAMNQGLAESFGNVRSQAESAAISDRALASMNDSLASSFGPAVTMTRLETEQLRLLAETELVAAGAAAALADAQKTAAGTQGISTMAGMMNAIAAVTAAGGGGGGGGGATGWLATSIAWWQRWRSVIHWAVMGTMEILATAIPAIVAFGGAMVAMYPAVEQLKDHFSNLNIAAGGLSHAVASMPGPMGQLSSTMGRLSRAVAPDVWMILGSAISIVTAHTGAFAGIAQQASNVLGNFAAKIVTDLQGPAGKAMQDFFANGVTFMIQWGQVLGQFGHAFLDIFHAMPGIGHVVLGVLAGISQVLLAIAGNPVAATLLGIMAALSGLYRYAILVGNALRFLWAATGLQALSTMITDFAFLTSEMGLFGAATWVATGAMTALENTFRGLLPFLAVLAPGVLVAGLDILVGKLVNEKTAVEETTAAILRQTPTVQNLSLGTLQLSTMLNTAQQAQKQVTQQVAISNTQAAEHARTVASQTTNVGELSGALQTEYNRLKQVQQGLIIFGSTNGQVAANMAVLNIATGMQDSNVQKVNQAWNAYLQLLTGGMSTLANYTTALGNMTSVAATTGIDNLGRSVGQLDLTAQQFAASLQSGAVKGASAWQNFTQVMNGNLGPMANYLQEAKVAGVITGSQLTQALGAATAAMIPYTGTTGTAAQMLLAFYRQSGDNKSSLADLQKQYGNSGDALNTLNGIMTTATIGMSNASQVAQNMSAVFNTQVTQALVAAALKASGFQTDVQNMMQAQKTGTDANGHDWQYWASQAANAWNNAQTAATNGTSTILGDLNKIPNNTTKTLHINVSGPSLTPGQAAALGLIGGPSAAAIWGHGQATAGAAGGMVHGPGTGTSDSVPARLSHGEYIVRAAAVQHYGQHLFDALNARKLAAGGPASITPGVVPAVLEASVSGGGAVNLHHHSNTNVTVGGHRLMGVARTSSLTYQRRNPANNLSLRYR